MLPNGKATIGMVHLRGLEDRVTELEGKGTLAYCENTTGTAAFVTAFTTSAVLVPGMILTVEPTSQDVWIRWGGQFGISTAGAGLLTMRLWEITDSGSIAVKAGPLARTENLPVTAFGATVRGHWRLGPTATTRQFYCDVIAAREAGSSLAGYLCNSYNNGAGAELAKTWMAAVAQ